MRNAIAAICAALMVASAMPAFAGPPGPPAIPQPKILVIDKQAIMLRSSAGQSMMQQAKAMMLSLQKEYDGKISALRSEAAKQQQQNSILSNDVKAQKARDLDSRARAIQLAAQNQQNMIKGGMLRAQDQIGAAVGPILKGLMMERGANMLLDRNAVILSTVDIDVTQVVVQRLNQKLATVKVTPAPLPPGVQPTQ